MFLLDTNYDGAFVDSIHVPICPKKYWVYCCAWSILRKSSEAGFPLIEGWSLNPIMIFLELPYESRCPLCGSLHLTVKLPAHWKLNLPSFKTEALFQEMIFTRKFRLQKLALISVSLFFICYFATSQSTLGHYWRDTGTLTQWSITAILSIFTQKVVGSGNPGVLCTLKL